MATNCDADSVAVPPFGCELGRALLRLERPLLEERVRRFHGDAMLWCGVDPACVELTDRCMVRHRFQLSPSVAASCPEASIDSGVARLCAALTHLPMRNNQFDGVVLHHALDVVADPRAAIREVSRVITPGGRLVITAVNPVSFLGLRVLGSRVAGDALKTVRPIPPWRLLDWLSVLGFTRETRVSYRAFFPPWAKRAPGGRLAVRAQAWLESTGLPLGGLYMIEARKQAAAMRPLWRRRSLRAGKLAPVALPKLSARNRS